MRYRYWNIAILVPAGNGSAGVKVKTTDHLTKWKFRAKMLNILKRETLTPILSKYIEVEEFPFLQTMTKLPDNLESTLKELSPWTYFIDFGHINTAQFGILPAKTLLFHRYRSKLISETVADMLGDDLKNSSILDLGCNCGFFSFDLASRGAKSVLGIDVRQGNIDQAKFLRDLLRIDNTNFQVANVKNLEIDRRFDVVLCLGLMYHLSTPYEVMKSCYELTTRFCVVDSICHTEPLSAYHLIVDKNTSSNVEGDLSFELQPTYRALLDTVRSAGFENVVEIIGECDQEVELYHDMTRRCIFAFKAEPPAWLSSSTHVPKKAHAKTGSRVSKLEGSMHNKYQLAVVKHRPSQSLLRSVLWAPLPLPWKIAIKNFVTETLRIPL